MRELPRHRRHLLNGSTVTEFLVVIPAMLLLGLGVIQSLFFYQAKTVANYATFEAARKGAVTHAQPATMLDEFGLRMAAALGGDGSPEKLLEVIKKGREEARDKDITRIDILSPTREAFVDFAVFNADSGKDELPNHHLRYQDRTPGARGKVSIQDANLLTIQTTYGYKLTVPFVNKIVTAALARLDSANAAYYEAGRIPMKSQATVRMHSPVWLNDSMLALNQLPGASGNGGLGISGGGSSSGTNSGVGNNTGGEPGGGQNNLLPDGEEETEHQCTTTWEDARYTVEDRECDRWFCELKEFTDRIAAAANIVWDFLEGLLVGIGQQAKDLWEILSNPSVLLDVAKAFIEQPKEMLKQLISGIGSDIDKVLNCGPGEIGKFVGENLSPNSVLNVVSRLAKVTGNLNLRKFVENKKEDPFFCVTSFPAGTKVWTPDGQRNIEGLKVGDLVYARDEETFEFAPQRITKISSRVAPNYRQINTEFGWISLTAEHPIWVQGEGWVAAADVDWEDPIATIKDDVVSYENELVNEEARVYSFSVENTPNYFVGAMGLWVHNVNVNCTAKGLIGAEFEDYLVRILGGRGSFKSGGREFDGAINNRWYEAISGRYWQDHAQPGKGFEKFKSDIGSRKSIAERNGATFEIHSNSPIPQHVKDWLTEKGIPFTEH
jgi:hypothetical protein